MHARRFANVTLLWLTATNKRPSIYACKLKKIRFRRAESNYLMKSGKKLKLRTLSISSVLREVPINGCIYNFCSRTEDGWFVGAGGMNIFACSMLLDVS